MKYQTTTLTNLDNGESINLRFPLIANCTLVNTESGVNSDAPNLNIRFRFLTGSYTLEWSDSLRIGDGRLEPYIQSHLDGAYRDICQEADGRPLGITADRLKNVLPFKK